MAKSIPKLKQIALLEKIAQLSKAGIHQRDIAMQLCKYGHGVEKEIGQSCLDALGFGRPFSHGLANWISLNAYQSLSSGEAVGEFVQGVQDAIEALNVDEASTGALFKVLIKPIVGLGAILGISALLSKYAYPSLLKQLPIHRWGGLSQFSYDFGLFWLNYGVVVIVLTIGLIGFVALTISKTVTIEKHSITCLSINNID
uniref:Type II secretion system protein GspF domain-containing protein n=1 Tax=Aliivibrio fischeri TaxID=668 RepID=H2ERX6_ALIFS|nr:hypothetical protein [Aliivibrio fischeri]AEY78143.1 hypothetical protein [Aliivibrio fischeri]